MGRSSEKAWKTASTPAALTTQMTIESSAAANARLAVRRLRSMPIRPP
jgi:hypothetical protein